MAHVRRYFEKALENDRALAEYALQLIQALYALERTAQQQHLDVVQRQALRESKALPLLKEWKTWLDQQQQNVLPKSSIGKAVHYTLNLWPRLVRYVEDGNYCIDNNLIENTIRPLALGRKNYLFAGSHDAAQRAAMFYSFFGTCKINQVEPYAWLKSVLEQLPEAKVNDLERFLPNKWTHPPQAPLG